MKPVSFKKYLHTVADNNSKKSEIKHRFLKSILLSEHCQNKNKTVVFVTIVDYVIFYCTNGPSLPIRSKTKSMCTTSNKKNKSIKT